MLQTYGREVESLNPLVFRLLVEVQVIRFTLNISGFRLETDCNPRCQ